MRSCRKSRHRLAPSSKSRGSPKFGPFGGCPPCPRHFQSQQELPAHWEPTSCWVPEGPLGLFRPNCTAQTHAHVRAHPYVHIHAQDIVSATFFEGFLLISSHGHRSTDGRISRTSSARPPPAHPTLPWHRNQNSGWQGFQKSTSPMPGLHLGSVMSERDGYSSISLIKTSCKALGQTLCCPWD